MAPPRTVEGSGVFGYSRPGVPAAQCARIHPCSTAVSAMSQPAQPQSPGTATIPLKARPIHRPPTRG
jgi:hypothetical protein